MSARSRRRWARLGGAALLTLPSVIVDAAGGSPAYADASAPPPFSSLQPVQGEQEPCPGATNPAKGAANSAAEVPYQVPFRAIIFGAKPGEGGEIKVPPYVVVPHFFATACGEIRLPQLTGTLTGFDVATPNVYIAGLEALPSSVTFPTLDTTIDAQPAPNGGLDLSITGTAIASVSTLGMTCSIDMPVDLTTKTDGSLTGQPVTGPTQDGQAVVVGNSFPVPAVAGSETGTCPPAVAQALNKLLGLPARPGVGSFEANLCFDFELEHTTIPAKTADCPWPSS